MIKQQNIYVKMVSKFYKKKKNGEKQNINILHEKSQKNQFENI